MTMERRIPHVRDVFSDLRSYDHSPRSRRKEPSSPPPSRRQHQQPNQQPTSVTGGVAPPTQPLTERDFRHLERHLSMKKTIRKQISRNLAQAFVEDPKVLSNNAVNHANHGRQQPPQQPVPQPQVITLTRAKIARSDQNFLDMLKEPQHRASAEESRVAAESCSSNQPSFWKFLGLKGKSKR
ncbi:hypothetical protein HPB47_009108 [Ixodes persulcatus]|uniref:Uncharacterized protein n=1 Tax=Ixodes persulcatus TaxID=34615 RepID=A0AC60P2X4_IXOPE|nr:hypothetical protein HPB47_009108 [Ixodes persulcatus]